MKQYLALGALALGLAAALPAGAASFSFGFNNVLSQGALDEPGNTQLSFNLGAGSFITGLRYEVDVEAYTGSWLSEISLSITGKSGEGIDFLPAPDRNTEGRYSASGSLDLLNQGLGFRLGSDGQLKLQFYDEVKDLAGADGVWHSGKLTFDYVAAPVPEPATWASLAAGLAALGLTAARRRRRADTPG